MLKLNCISLRLPLSEEVRNLIAGLTKEKGTSAIDSAYSVYSSTWGSHPEQATVKKTVADIETDFLFLVPTQTALQLHAEKSRSALALTVLAAFNGFKSFKNTFLYLT